MRLYAAGQEYAIENKADIAVTIMNIVEQIVKEQSLVFCGFQIDGEEFYGDLAEFFMERGTSIESVVAILLTEDQLKQDTLISIESYIRNALPILDKLYNDFYNGPSEETWNDLGQLVEGLEWISKAAEFTDSRELLDYREEAGNIGIAVSQQDTGLIGDIIQFEIIPRFEKARDTLVAMVGGVHVDIN
ncbi:hypothetical protein EDM57_18795 [Brevibacillus gelatini]|uniref:Uncharacterized protein n=1 Tax=Brevibacillus gelatini TaxID=1655277 RepID=A0A3M8ARN2_9BACL|nr:hypothetical protein [Brevibacillus gelatini]RNB53850.1 hypothetical protein EDM57_18795 [Brevibacillus gelatini]